ncbi:uncharacterized protein BXZ73DRAFT_103261 [Epithele typhae]|uniref:uncharacterized protein n=1 Tax=Epithele typhae TaxID=378194 RepID=UPI0020076D8A|nr:uncharacterized protein BXZ73DRAFT_103261 [Epithele typhae]KAH9925377.1 hypothetical protein BXZ73DRAFT_103261 [Epithele typhae]
MTSDRASPTPSDDSSDTPVELEAGELDEFPRPGGSAHHAPPDHPQGTSFSQLGSFFSSLSAGPKRRLGGNTSFMGLGGTRDAKSRRKDGGRAGGPGGHGPSGGGWEAGAMGRGRVDDLVDVGLMEQLKKQFGDPFDDTLLTKANKTQ